MIQIHEMLCVNCGNIYQRCSNGDSRIKLLEARTIYCFQCQKETKHVYIKNEAFMTNRLHTRKQLGFYLNPTEEYVYDLLCRKEALKVLRKR